MNKELIVVKGKVIEQERGYLPNAGKELTFEASAKMVKRHYDENPDDFVAQFVGREKLEAILRQPECIGLRMYYGKNELGLTSILLAGVDADGQTILKNPDIAGHENRDPLIVQTNKGCPPLCPETSGWM